MQRWQADGSMQDETTLRGTNVSNFGAITPSDSTDLTAIAISIAVSGSAGAVTVVKPDGVEVTIPADLLPVGQFIPFVAKRIKATGTTATGIWVFYK